MGFSHSSPVTFQYSSSWSWKKAQRIQHAIVQDDRPRGIFRVRHVNFEFDVATLAILLQLEFLPVAIGCGDLIEQQRVVQSTASLVYSTGIER